MIDQAELTWFLSTGGCYFERSPFGAVLDRLDNAAHVSRRCPICEDGIVTSNVKRWHSQRLLWVRNAPIGAWCNRCGGTGSIPQRLSCDEQKLVDDGTMTVRSDGDSQRAAVPDQVLVRYAHVSRTLSRMRPTLRNALMAAYGDEGEDLAATVHGRSWACSPLTPGGSRLLRLERDRRVRKKGVEPERPIRALTALARLNGHRKDPERAELLASAARDANALLRAAEAEWDRVIDVTQKRSA